ncbi:MAG: VCBS repeat-containing protein [Desulfobacteraceae bacterium]|nr:VCBS repeat-containing protein [Desulfobacteraceae bacterium]
MKKGNSIRNSAVAAVVSILLCGFGCTKSDEKEGQVAQKEKTTTREMAFLDGSNGLPSSGLWRQGMAFHDINRDGNIDILAPPPRKASAEDRVPFVWYGDGKGNWSKAKLAVPSDLAYDYGSIAVSDFNGDGLADIALAMHGLGVKVLAGTGGGNFVSLCEGMPSVEDFMSRALIADDFDNDGVPDIAAVSEARFEVKLASPTGPWAFSISDNTWKGGAVGGDAARGLYADQLVSGDVNGDGNRDIALASLLTYNHNVIWIGDGKGGFAPSNNGLPTGVVYYPSVGLGDIDGDGRDDLVAFVSGIGKDADFGLRAFLSGPDGFKEVSEGLPQKQGIYTAISVSDLDGDGRPEIVGGTMDGVIKIFSMKGERWEKIQTSGLPEKELAKIYNIYCVDLNGDGHKDIAFCYSSGKLQIGGIRVFLNVSKKI